MMKNVNLHREIAWLTACLVVFGCLMVYSTTLALPISKQFSGYSTTHFIYRHIFFIFAGLIVAYFTLRVPMIFWYKSAPWFLFISVILLILVLVPGVGKGVKGAQRWINLGLVSFQPSELAKLAIIFYISGYIVRRQDVVKENFWKAVMPIVAAVGIIGLLLLAEPDMGAFMVIAVIAMSLLFIGGVNVKMFLLIAISIILVFSIIIYLSDWRRERIFAYLNPWSAKFELGKGYQLTHALIAVGRGGLIGVGLGAGIEKLHWLPEAHTDFILAIVGEELGLIGIIILMSLFYFLIRKVLLVGRQSILLENYFSGYAVQGIAIWLGFQVFVNIGVNLGALPTKGLTLPLLSYGGSAMLVCLIAIAIVLRVNYENNLSMRLTDA